LTLITTNREDFNVTYFPVNTTTSATNLLFENIDIVGQNDGWYFNSASCTSTSINCRVFSHWDAFYNTAATTNSYFKFISCTFNAVAGTVAGGFSNNANGLVAFGGNIELINCSVVATGAFTNTCAINALTNSTQASKWTLKNTTLQTASQFGNATNFYILGNTVGVDQYLGDFIYYPNVAKLGSITPVNFVDGAKNTNTTGRPITVKALAYTVPAAVGGQDTYDLQVDQTQSGTFVLYSRVGGQTTVASLSATNWGTLTASINTNGVYTFTNTSSGGGNSGVIVSGTGHTQVN
jgi:hypothetical protein